MDKEIIKLFSLLKCNNIRYVILRGYMPLEELNDSDDIDIYVHKNDSKKLIEVLKKEGWYKPKLNVNKSPHIQLYKFSLEKIYKVDLVTDLYFGNEFYYLEHSEDVIKRRKLINDLFYVPNEVDALKLLELHVILDKKQISIKNRKRLEQLRKAIEVNSISVPNWQLTLLYDLLNSSSNDIVTINDELKYKFNIIPKKSYRIKSNIKYKITLYLAKLRNSLKNNSICIIGVDGTGKSTVVKGLDEILSNHVVIQYMGFRSYETKLAQKYNTFKPEGIFQNFVETFVIYFEMWYRYLKNRFNRNGVVVFDRFVNESYINAKGLRKIMTTTLFKYLFPKPRKMYYLYCPVEISLERKDDILNKEQFKLMKNNFDNIYLGNSKILSFDSSNNDVNEILKNIYKDLVDDFAEYII